MTSSKNTKLQSQQRWRQFLLKGLPKIQTIRYFYYKKKTIITPNKKMIKWTKKFVAEAFSFPKQVPKKVHFEDA